MFAALDYIPNNEGSERIPDDILPTLALQDHVQTQKLYNTTYLYHITFMPSVEVYLLME